ncbi:cytidylyltransferase domain-containing protein [Nostoc sp. LEGE 12450]|uniref:cytidylyltransferase domain-containing protein n=1 Tax=Nostoc sp. LEGE 12450 TaxID=1828643 RepID=UPI0018823FFE|nr:NTP transferase domain-containing protein [Nostoc sp. LEGE 12450]MBE8985970.1 NTP transferase domain-containing protein [Nostoc sp. LEGE 12450]
MSRVVAGIQARMGSTRLPGKSLIDLGGKPIIHWVIDRVKRANQIDEVWVLTTTNPEDDALVKAVESKANILRGDPQDVRSRYNLLIQKTNASLIFRITADCPLIDWTLLDALVYLKHRENADYTHILAQPCYQTSYPNGFNAELFTKDAFAKISQLGTSTADKEHVTLAVDNFPEKFKIARLGSSQEFSRPQWKLSVDTNEELNRVRLIISSLGTDAEYASVKDIVAVLDAHPEWQHSLNENLL